MRSFRWSDNYLVWVCLEFAAISLGAWGMWCLVQIAGAKSVGEHVAPATILLSVAVAIVIQLWVKLNELSSLTVLSNTERARLSKNVRLRLRALVWLVVYLVLFIFFVLTASVLSASENSFAAHLLSGIGAGCGALVVIIAAVLIDLNEVAEFRWAAEINEQERKLRNAVLAELSKQEPGFADDEHIQSYKNVSGGH